MDYLEQALHLLEEVRRTQGEVQVPDEEKRNPSAETLDTRRDVRPQWPRGAAPPAYATEEAPK